MSERWVIILLLAFVVAGLATYVASRDERAPKPLVTNDRPVEKPKPRRTVAVAAMTSCKRIGGRTQVTGEVMNTGTTQLTALTVESIWKDGDGLVIGTGLVYVVGESDPLAPGDSRPFTDTTRIDGVARCNVEVVDYFASDEASETEEADASADRS